jgi:hypothetical protein
VIHPDKCDREDVLYSFHQLLQQYKNTLKFVKDFRGCVFSFHSFLHVVTSTAPGVARDTNKPAGRRTSECGACHVRSGVLGINLKQELTGILVRLYSRECPFFARGFLRVSKYLL